MSLEREHVPWEAIVRDPLSLAMLHERAEEHRSRSLVERAAELGGRLSNARFERGEISKRLVESATAANAPRASIDAALRMSDPRAIAVITGQQPGFLGGPLLTFLKAAQTVALARAIGERSGLPTVALFWNHSDDHDLDETRSVSLADAHGSVHRIAVDLGRGRPFLADVVLDASVEATWSEVEPLLPAGPDRDRVVELFRPRPGARFAAETTRILLELLGEAGLVVFEPRDLRAQFSRALAEISRSAVEGLAALSRVAGAVRARGFTPPIPEDDPPLLFERTAAGRERVRWSEGRFKLPGGTTLDAGGMADAILREPDRFSAGVATRVAVEAIALPVVAAVRGPAELAYAPLALSFLPAAARREPPVLVPRFSATLIEPRIDRALEAVGVSAREVIESPEGLASKAPELDASPEERELESLEADVARRLRAIEPALNAEDPNLAKPFEKTLASSTGAFASLRTKLRRARQDRAGASESRLRRLAAALRPLGQPQERTTPIAPFLCAGVVSRMEQLQSAMELVPNAHTLVPMDPSP